MGQGKPVAHLKIQPVAATNESFSRPDHADARRVTARAVLMSLLLIVGMCWWIAYSEVRTATTEITCTALPIGVVFALFIASCVNLLIARRWPRHALAPGEMATLYVLVAVGSSVAGIGMVGFLTPALANPVWFTNDHWKQFADAVPAWWSPRDHEAVQSYFMGNSTLYTAGHLRAWLPPILVWGGFLLLIMLMTMCFAAILRRQWVEHERLTFPITYLPVAMTVQEGGFAAFIRNRTLWAGFAIPVVLQTINSLNYLIPSLPAIPVKPVEKGPLDLGTLFSSPPWNAIGSLPLAFHPNSIGLSYLLSTDVSFSCWFFHLLRKFLEVFSVAMGWRTGAGATAGARMPYTSEQGVGAWLCLAFLVIWMARTHLRAVI